MKAFRSAHKNSQICSQSILLGKLISRQIRIFSSVIVSKSLQVK